MAKLTFDDIFWRLDTGERIEPGMTIRRRDPVDGQWYEGKVIDRDHENQRIVLSLSVEGKAPSPLQVGDEIKVVSEAELYEREMQKRNQIWVENREKPWLPIDPDGE